MNAESHKYYRRITADSKACLASCVRHLRRNSALRLKLEIRSAVRRDLAWQIKNG